MTTATRKRAPKRQPAPAVRPALDIRCAYCGGGSPVIQGLPTFALTYAAAEACGWRRDSLGAWRDRDGSQHGGQWTCPACVALPGWWAPCTPKLASEQPPSRPHPLETTGALTAPALSVPLPAGRKARHAAPRLPRRRHQPAGFVTEPAQRLRSCDTHRTCTPPAPGTPSADEVAAQEWPDLDPRAHAAFERFTRAHDEQDATRTAAMDRMSFEEGADL